MKTFSFLQSYKKISAEWNWTNVFYPRPICGRKFTQRYNMSVHQRLNDISSNRLKNDDRAFRKEPWSNYPIDIDQKKIGRYKLHLNLKSIIFICAGLVLSIESRCCEIKQFFSYQICLSNLRTLGRRSRSSIWFRP